MPQRPTVLLALLGVAVLSGCAGGEAPVPVRVVSADPPVPRFTTSVGWEFVLIPGGTFTMGDPNPESQPKHQVTLSPFYVARYVVTKGVFARFLRETKRQYAPPDFAFEFADAAFSLDVPFTTREALVNFPAAYIGGPTANHTLYYATYAEAVALAEWLSRTEGRSFQVITEAQAEYIARSGVAVDDQALGNQMFRFWWQATQPSSPGCWITDLGTTNTGPAMYAGYSTLFAMTPWGMYVDLTDFWTADRYRAGYPDEPQVDPTGPARGDHNFRAVRSLSIARHPGSPENKSLNSILLVSPIQPSDHRPWTLPPEPAVAPVAVQPLERQALDLGGGVSLAMRKIPTGSFVMGRPERERYWTFEWPETTMVMQDYWLGETEVTQAQFRAVTGVNPSLIKGDDLPVHSVTMGEMIAFGDLLTRQERAAGRLGSGEEYRLPTEAEWERAARAGTKTHWSCGDDADVLRRYAWFDQIGAMGPQPVARKWPNPWGFFDMEGNVFERCTEHNYTYAGGERSLHWLAYSSGNTFREWYSVRGGSFNMGAIASEPTIRRAMHAQSRVSHVGFRLVRGPALPQYNIDNNDAIVLDRAEIQKGKDYQAIMATHGQTPAP